MDTPTSSRASLLSVPIETRLQIYTHVRCASIAPTALDSVKDGPTKQGFPATPVGSDLTRLQIPWLNLMLTSRTIAAEMKDLLAMDKKSAVPGQTRTYDLLIEASSNRGAVTWNRIPCAPEDARVLCVTFRARCRMQFWGDGGPRGIVQSLYQTLNTFLHCGPLLQIDRPLKQHVHLEKLIIRVDVVHTCRGKDESRFDVCSDSSRFVSSLHPDFVEKLASRLCSTGLLSGYVDRITVHTGRGDTDLVPEQVEHPKVPTAWNGYGFEWGPKERKGGARS